MRVIRYDDIRGDVIKHLDGDVIFLAGPTVRGNQQHLTSWRFDAIKLYADNGFEGTLIVPEFHSKTESDKSKEWIPLWENEGLKRANVIIFWLPRTRELIGLTTNFELGYWLQKAHAKVLYGRPSDAYRIGYTDIMWLQAHKEINRNCVIYDNLEGVVKGSIRRINSCFCGAPIDTTNPDCVHFKLCEQHADDA